MGTVFSFGWEIPFMATLQSYGGAFLTAASKAVTWVGDEVILVALILYLYVGPSKKAARYIFTNFAPALLLCPMIKNIICRRRPYMDSDRIQCLVPVDSSYNIYDVAAQGYSFPSMHAANSTVIYCSIPMYLHRVKKLRAWITAVCITLIVLIGLSRIYVGVHYPTDVLAGWIISLVLLVLMNFLQEKVRRKSILYACIAALGLPGLFFCRSNDFFSAWGVILGGFAGFLFEEHFVRFEPTKSLPGSLLRTAVGVALYYVLNVVLKLPFSDTFLDGGTLGAYLIRTARYTVNVFTVFAVYPLCFKPIDRLWARISKAEEFKKD